MTYEYVCETCGHQWEAEQSIKDQPLKQCASCGRESAKRLVSGGTGFLLKGGGWYADLYSSSGAKSASSTDNKDKSEAKRAAETSTATEPKADTTKAAAKSSPSTSSTVAAKAS